MSPPTMSNLLSRHFLSMAYNNAWANHRLLKACALLSQADFVTHRTSFFPSIMATLNHNVTVDWFYIDALERELRDEPPHPDIMTFFDPEEPFATCAELQRAQPSGKRAPGCSNISLSIRSITVDKHTRCFPEHRSRRPNWTNSSAK